MPCFITHTGSYLPGAPVDNDEMEFFLGTLEGEADVKRQVLRMNGIERRHYAQSEQQVATHDVYQLATEAARSCFANASCTNSPPLNPVTYLSAGTTYAPYSGPGIASIVHCQLQKAGLVERPVEISSHSGICTSAAAAMVAAIRAVESGEHAGALCLGAEHASEVLKSTVIRPIDDRSLHSDLRHSQWFMSVFLRFMLSDGAGAFLLADSPKSKGVSFKVDWTHSMSFAHIAPLCMKLDNHNHLLSQDITILSRFLFTTGGEFLRSALTKHHESLAAYSVILPHLSSYFFRRKFERIVQSACEHSAPPIPYWTNLASAGNTGAASIYIMLDHYLQQHTLRDGQRLLLFVPESGQFNFVLVSLTTVSR